MEICLPLVFFWISTASADMLNLKVWTKECSLMSIRVLLKMSILYNISAFLIHIMSHLIWTVHLGFNHPLPNLGTVIILTTWIIAMIGHWFLLPSDLLAKEDFRKKLRTYIIYFLWNIIVNVAREGLSYLFYNFPTKLQFIAPFFVAGFREFDKRITSKIVNKMMGQQDEPATALVSITISCVYGFFIAVRLTRATLATIFCTAAIDLVLHLNVTRQIIHEHKKVSGDTIQNGMAKKSIKTTKLVLAELMEGFTPMIYAICMATAYYGPNNHLFVNIGSSFWGKKIENISPVFSTMLILFLFDAISAVFNSIFLWKIMSVSMLQEFYRVFSKYWIFMAIKLGIWNVGYFGTTDVNFGLDTSGSHEWITPEGRQNLIWNSADLTDEEKTWLLGNVTLT